MHTVTVFSLPPDQSYTKLFKVQQQLHALRVAHRIGDVVLMLEHSPVITIGRTPHAARHMLATPEFLQQQGIEVCQTNRGGDVTYHGPGQMVVYFIMALAEHDLHAFVRKLERSVIRLLAAYRIRAHIKPEYPGVWVGEEKICALGVYVKQWVTMHGIALNVCPDLTHFQYIVPCGIQGKGVTTLEQLTQQSPDIAQVQHDYIEHVTATFQVHAIEEDPHDLWALLASGSNDTSA